MAQWSARYHDYGRHREPCRTCLASLQEANMHSKRHLSASIASMIIDAHCQTHCRPISVPTLQTLPTAIVQRILRCLDRDHLKVLFSSPSRRLKACARFVMLEQLAHGIALFNNNGDYEREQVRRKIALCGSIREVARDSSMEKLAQTISEHEHKGKFDVQQVKRKVALCEVIDSARRVAGNIDCGSKPGLKGRIRDTTRGKQLEAVGGRQHDWAQIRTEPLAVAPCLPRPQAAISRDVLPDEIVLQILREQSYRLLRGLRSCRSNQLQRIAETVLFERRHALFRFCMSREGSSKLWGERKSCPAVSEKGEEYVERRFVLVNCRDVDDSRGQFWSEEDGVGELALGTYWKLICKAVDS